MLKIAKSEIVLPVTGAAIVASPSLERTSGAFSADAKLIDQVFYASSARSTALFSDAAELPHTAFELKSALAPFSMHLPAAWRKSLFNQLDEILCQDAWDLDDAVPSKSSWATLIRLIVFCRFKVIPGLGFAIENPMLSWIHQNIRINITCFPNDIVRWTASRILEDDVETSIGDTKPRRIRMMLAAYNDDNWLLDV